MLVGAAFFYIVSTFMYESLEKEKNKKLVRNASDMAFMTDFFATAAPAFTLN